MPLRDTDAINLREWTKFSLSLASFTGSRLTAPRYLSKKAAMGVAARNTAREAEWMNASLLAVA